MLNSLRIGCFVGAVLLALSLSAPGRAAQGDPAPAAAQAEGSNAAAAAGPTQPAGTPGAAAAKETPPQVDPQKAAACKKMIEELRTKASAVQSLPKDRRAEVVSAPATQDAVICLAIANANPAYCDILADESKKACLAQFEIVNEMRDVPKEQMKGHVIHHLCMNGQLCEGCGKKECDNFAAAINTGDAAKCAGFDEPVRSFCTAQATRDATKCNAIPAGEGRSLCEAFATEDVKRCSADSPDCRNLTNSFATFRKQGLAGMQELDPGVAAGAKGRDACKPLLAKFEKACREGH